jgi:hypothetical protein
MLPPTVTISLHVIGDDLRRLDGSFDSDDPVADRLLVLDIQRRRRLGDVWAWADVEVRATHVLGYTGSDYLCGCCYADEADFKRPGGYYDDMVYDALDALDKSVDASLHRRDPTEGVTLWLPI